MGNASPECAAVLSGGGKYATMFYCLLDREGLFSYVNAAHCPPVVVGRTGAQSELNSVLDHDSATLIAQLPQVARSRQVDSMLRDDAGWARREHGRRGRLSRVSHSFG